MANSIAKAQQALTSAENHLVNYRPLALAPWFNLGAAAWLSFAISGLIVSAALFVLADELIFSAANWKEFGRTTLGVVSSFFLAGSAWPFSSVLWWKLITGRPGLWMERLGLVMHCSKDMTLQINYQLKGSDTFFIEQTRRLTQACAGRAMSLQCGAALVNYLDRRKDLESAKLSLVWEMERQEEIKNSPLVQMQEQAAQAAALELSAPAASAGSQPRPRL